LFALHASVGAEAAHVKDEARFVFPQPIGESIPLITAPFNMNAATMTESAVGDDAPFFFPQPMGESMPLITTAPCDMNAATTTKSAVGEDALIVKEETPTRKSSLARISSVVKKPFISKACQEQHIAHRVNGTFQPLLNATIKALVAGKKVGDLIVPERSGVRVYRKDFAGLVTKKGWLSDAIIDFMALLLQDRHRRAPSCMVRSMLIMSPLMFPLEVTHPEEHPESLQDPLQHDRVFLPINIRNSHWVLVVVDTILRIIRYYDSLGVPANPTNYASAGLRRSRRKPSPHDVQPCPRRLIKTVLLWLEFWEKRRGNQSLPIYQVAFNDHQAQEDGSSCGVFVIAAMDCESRGVNPRFITQAHAHALRARYAAEMVEGRMSTPGGDEVEML
jgi:hypothetical protein